MNKPHICKIVKKEKLNKRVVAITLENSELAVNAKPGQFIHIKCGSSFSLRRPISIFDAVGDKLTFVFEVKGEGTKWLAGCNVGDSLDVLGPLGRGFTTKGVKKALVIGGGIGIYPLFLTAKNVEVCDSILGFRTKKLVTMENYFTKVCRKTYIATDDGSYGIKGFVTNVLQEAIKEESYDIIYACGPFKMLECIAKIAMEAKIPCEISMEQRMGCGIGACLVCACKVKSRMKDVEFRYSHVCKEGPVYKAEEVDFNV